MSDVQKPVEEQPVAPVEAAPVVEPTLETKVEEPVVPAVEETAAVAEPAKDVVEPAAATEEPAAATTDAATPSKEFTGEGTLGYKAPGRFITKITGFQKKLFWLGSEPVEHKNLASYLRGEKQEIANHNAAWSSQTGKGLLYFSKHPSDKATPAGIINLADASDVSHDGPVDFFFHVNNVKHVFQAATVAERDRWVETLKAKITEAKELAEGIKGSDGYKEQLSTLSKPTTTSPVAAAAAAIPKAVETKKEEKAEAKEEKKDEKTRKSRSASRKRTSIFGTLGFKKEEPVEDKKPEASETALVEPETAEAVTSEPDVAPLDGPAVAEAVVAAPVVEEPAKAEASAEVARPAFASKRNSIFGSLSSKFNTKKSITERKASSEVAPVVPAKDIETAEPVSAEAPVIPAPEASESLAAAVQSPATVPVTETNGVTETEEVKPETKPEAKTEAKTETAQKRKSSLPFGLGAPKEKATEVDGEKPKSPFAKLRQTIRGKSSPKAAEKVSEKEADKTEETVAEPAATETPATEIPATATTEAVSEPVISEPVSAAHEPSPQVSATA